MKNNYYAEKLNSRKLFDVYETGIERIRQYLEAEIGFVRDHLQGNERVLELGAGYGRILKELAPFAASVTGIDVSAGNVAFGNDYLKEVPNVRLEVMDAHNLLFGREFDVVLCLQNGICSMKGDPRNLVAQIAKVLTDGGRAFISSYSPEFWEHRLAWFHEQAEKGLLGEIDLEKTANGTIICKDGFVATTCLRNDMEKLAQEAGLDFHIQEVDGSSVFLVISR